MIFQTFTHQFHKTLFTCIPLPPNPAREYGLSINIFNDIEQLPSHLLGFTTRNAAVPGIYDDPQAIDINYTIQTTI
jgi:hypothetical protein